MFINIFKRVILKKNSFIMNLGKKSNNKKQDGRKVVSRYFASTSTVNESSKETDSYSSDTDEQISLKRSPISKGKIIKKVKQEPEECHKNISLKSTKSKKNIKNVESVKKVIKPRAKNVKKELKKKENLQSNNQSDEESEQFQSKFIYKGHEFKLKWAPQNFQETWDNIEKMRVEQSAPVDTMGCSHCHDDQADLKVQRFHSLVALMLSSQTRDEINYAAMNRLKDHGLTVQNILDIEESKLAKIIRPVSFYNTKAKNLKKVSLILREQYDDDIPKTAEELCALPGVGPKMAHLTMYCAWKKITGIAVDTHVLRIVNRLKWVRKETKTPEKTMADLEDWLPKSLWWEINENLVGFGQTICTAINPKCTKCLNAKTCPFAKKHASK